MTKHALQGMSAVVCEEVGGVESHVKWWEEVRWSCGGVESRGEVGVVCVLNGGEFTHRPLQAAFHFFIPFKPLFLFALLFGQKIIKL